MESKQPKNNDKPKATRAHYAAINRSYEYDSIRYVDGTLDFGIA